MKRINLLTKNNAEAKTRSFVRTAGFTLLEIMVVVIIIGTIAGLVGVKVLDRLEQSREQAAIAQMASIKQALDLFKLDNGFYPLTNQGLEALVIPPDAGRMAGSYRTGGYLNSDTVPMDPWGNPYGFMSDGMLFQVWSIGQDGRDQTGDDIVG
jgi:general secretion pathway protein G